MSQRRVVRRWLKEVGLGAGQQAALRWGRAISIKVRPSVRDGLGRLSRRMRHASEVTYGSSLSLALLLSAALFGVQPCGWAASSNATDPATARFEFAHIGDVPYTVQEEAKFPDLVSAIDRTSVAFVVHSGDFKGGSSPCTDELFSSRYELFRTFKHPLIYVFGDNEWTDCHRSGFDPLDRLAKLRERFTQGESSLGQRPLPLTRQSDNPLYSQFRENVRWRIGSVIFIALNIAGSNNNFPTTLRSGVTVGNLEEL